MSDTTSSPESLPIQPPISSIPPPIQPPISPTETRNILSMLSIGDSAHDFTSIKIEENTFKTAFTTAFTGNDKTKKNFQQIYCNGLYTVNDTQPYSDENKCFNSVIDTSNKLDEPYIFKLVIKKKDSRDITSQDSLSLTPTVSDIKNYYKTNNLKRDSNYYNRITKAINGEDSSSIQETFSNYTLITVNGIDYQVLGKVIATEGGGSDDDDIGKKFINGIDLLNDLNLIERDKPNQKIAIIVDAAAVSLFNILKTGPVPMTQSDITNRPTVYYAFTSEVENDPATKQSPLDVKLHKEIFNIQTDDTGVILKPLIQKFSNTDTYKYGFNMSNINNISSGNYKDILPYDSFYTKYKFNLSGLKQKQSGLNKKIYTNLTVSNETDKRIIQKPIEDSKSCNEINFIKSLMQNTINKIISNLKGIKKSDITYSENEQGIFDINSAFQQKRSGDWLQVLACKTLFSRQMCEVNFENNKVKINDDCSKSPITPFTDVYFVTHDRIALAFALLNGVNCIYTHGDTTACYSFKITDPVALLQRKKQNILEIINLKDIDISKYKDADVFVEKINKYHQVYDTKEAEYLQKLTIKFNELKEFIFNSYPDAEVNEQDIQHTDVVPNTISNKTNIDASEFTQKCRNLFKIMFEYSVFHSSFPNLKNISLEYTKHSTKIKDLLNNPDLISKYNEYIALLESQASTSVMPEEINEIKDLLYAYSKLNDIHSKLKVVDTFVDSGNSVNKMEINKLLSKSSEYKLIDVWNWDIKHTRGSRLIDIFETLRSSVIPRDTTAFKQDKNAFLYMIHHLPENFSKIIIRLFTEIFNKIQTSDEFINSFVIKGLRNTNVILQPEKKDMLKVFLKNICIELFIAIGGLSSNPTEDDLKQHIKKINDYFLENTIFKHDQNLVDSRICTALQIYQDDLIKDKLISSKLNKILSDESVGWSNQLTSDDYLNKDESDIHDTIDVLIDQVAVSPYNEQQRIVESNIKRKRDEEKEEESSKRYAIQIQANAEVMESEGGGKVSNLIKRKVGSNKNRKTKKNNRNYINQRAGDGDGYQKNTKPIVTLLDYNNCSIFRTLLSNILLTQYLNYIQLRVIPLDLGGVQYNNNIISLISPQYTFSTLIQNYFSIQDVPQNGGTNTYTRTDAGNVSGNNILKMNFCFHPLLPVYMMVYAVHIFSYNNNVEDSLDYELFKRYFMFLKSLKEQLEKKCDVENIKSQMEASIIGLGLKELLFTADLTEHGIDKKDGTNIFGIQNKNLLSMVYQMNSILGYSIIGDNLNYNEDDEKISIWLLNNSIFKHFIDEEVKPKDIFEGSYQGTSDIEELKINMFDLMKQISEKMYSDKKNDIMLDDNEIEELYQEGLRLNEENIQVDSPQQPSEVLPPPPTIPVLLPPKPPLPDEVQQQEQQEQEQQEQEQQEQQEQQERLKELLKKTTSNKNNEKSIKFATQLMELQLQLQKVEKIPIQEDVPIPAATAAAAGGSKKRKTKRNKHKKNKTNKNKS